MQITPKSELIAIIQDQDATPGDLFAVGMILVGAACAKEGNTLQESIDKWRRLYDGGMKRQMEEILYQTWDDYKAWGAS